MTIDFHGAKIALLLGKERLLAYQRDDKAGIPFPGCWDLPGGGREGDETPVECVLREVDEEFGLSLAPDVVHWIRAYPSQRRRGAASYFMVGALTPEQCAAIRFGEEGQQWALMEVEVFLNHANAVPHLQRRLRGYLEQAGEALNPFAATKSLPDGSRA
jgi:8-oxo-dGTP diphosphatase